MTMQKALALNSKVKGGQFPGCRENFKCHKPFLIMSYMLVEKGLNPSGIWKSVNYSRWHGRCEVWSPNYSKFEAVFSIEKMSPLFSELDLQITMVDSQVWLSTKLGCEGQRSLSKNSVTFFILEFGCCYPRGPQTIHSSVLGSLKL